MPDTVHVDAASVGKSKHSDARKAKCHRTIIN